MRLFQACAFVLILSPTFAFANCEDDLGSAPLSPLHKFLQTEKVNFSLWRQVVITEDGDVLDYTYTISDRSFRLNSSEIFVAERSQKGGEIQLVFVERISENDFSVGIPELSTTTIRDERDELLAKFESRGLGGTFRKGGYWRIRFSPKTIEDLNQFLVLANTEFANGIEKMSVSWLGFAGPTRSNLFTKLAP